MPPQSYTLNLEGVDDIVLLTKLDAGSAPIEYTGSFKFEEKTYYVEVKNTQDGLIGEFYQGGLRLISSGFHHYTVIDRYIEYTWIEYLARASIRRARDVKIEKT